MFCQYGLVKKPTSAVGFFLSPFPRIPGVVDYPLLTGSIYDLPEKHEIVKLLAAEIPQSRQAVFTGAAHIVNMEQPLAFNRVVIEFFKDHLS